MCYVDHADKMIKSTVYKPFVYRRLGKNRRGEAIISVTPVLFSETNTKYILFTL